MGIQKSTCSLSVLFFFLLIFLSGSSNADPLDHWHWRNPLPQGNTLWGIAYGRNIFVAVGDLGSVLTSQDGTTWSVRSSGTTDRLLGIAHGNGIFVAVGDTGTILTSPDGSTWTNQSSDTISGLHGIAYGNGIFVAAGESGSLLTSSDGISWHTRASRSTSNFNSVAYGNGIFVAVGGSAGCIVGPPCAGTPGIILTSTDGITWTPRFSGNIFSGIAYGNGLFVAIANTPPPASLDPSSLTDMASSSSNSAIVMTSPDGITWTEEPLVGAFILSEVAYGDGIFVAVGNSILTSPDGVTWTPQSSGGNNSLNAIANGKGIFVAGGSLGVMLTSPDGANWTTRSSGPTDNLFGVTYGGGTFLAVGDGTILTSTEGATWTVQPSDTANKLFGVAYGNDTFVAVGYKAEISPACPVGECATILTSSDGGNWTVRFSDTSNKSSGTSFRGATFGNGTFVAVGYSVAPSGNLTGAIFISPDGVTWTPRFFGSPVDFFFGVTYGNGIFVAVSEHGIATSQDGMAWTTRISDNSIFLDGVAYGNGIFVVVGGSSNGTTILTSTDGMKWTAGPSGPYGLSGVVYGNGTFIATVGGTIGNTAVAPILTSSDGVKWITRPISAYSLSGIAYGNGTFVAVGGYGTILQSAFLPLRYSISGMVRDVPGGTGLGGINILLTKDGVTFKTVTTSYDSADIGSYTLKNLPAGTYAVKAYNGAYVFSGTETVTVGPSATNVDFARVKFTVKAASNKPNVKVIIINHADPTRFKTKRTSTSIIDRNGNYFTKFKNAFVAGQWDVTAVRKGLNCSIAQKGVPVTSITLGAVGQPDASSADETGNELVVTCP